MDTFEKGVVDWMKLAGRAYALTLTRNRANADDLVQTVAYRALRSRHLFDGNNLKAWLYRILRNEFFSTRRTAARRDTSSIDDVPDSFATVRPQQEPKRDFDRVLVAIGRMEPYNAWIMMAILDGHSYEDVAWMEDCSVGTVKSRLWRSRRHLERAMGEA